MAIVLDKTATLVQKDGTSGTTLDISFPSPPAVGSLVLVPIAIGNFAVQGFNSYVSVTDNQGNGTYNNIQQAAHPSYYVQTHLAYAIATNSSGTFTITFTFTGSATDTFMSVGAISFTGVQAVTDQVDSIAQDLNSPSVSLTTGTIASIPQLVVSLVSCSTNNSDNSLLQTAGGGAFINVYTEQDGSAHEPILFDYYIESSGLSTHTTTVTHDTTYDAGIIATFVGAAGQSIAAASGSYALTGIQSAVRVGASTYLRHRK